MDILVSIRPLSHPDLVTFRRVIWPVLRLHVCRVFVVAGVLSLLCSLGSFWLYKLDGENERSRQNSNRIAMVRSIFDSVEERLVFLRHRLDPSDGDQQVVAVLKKLPTLQNGVFSDSVIIRENQKLTILGSTGLQQADSTLRNEVSKIFQLSPDYLVIKEKIPAGVAVVRLSLSSLAKILNLGDLHKLSFSKKTQPREFRSIPIPRGGYLVYKETPLNMLQEFADKKGWMLFFFLLLPLSVVLIYMILHVFVFLSTSRRMKNYVVSLENNTLNLSSQVLSLERENAEMKKLAVASRQKQKIQEKIVAVLQVQRCNKLEKITELTQLVSHSIKGPDILNDQEIFKILKDVGRTSQELLDGDIEVDSIVSISVTDCLKEVEAYLSWDILRAKVTLTSHYDMTEIISDALVLKILLINLIYRRISRAYESSIIVLAISEGCISIKCDDYLLCGDGVDQRKDALLIPAERLPNIAEKIGFHMSEDKVSILLTPQPAKIPIKESRSNVVPLFN